MGYNSKYKSSEIEELLDQMSSGQSNIFLWNWNMAASGQLGDGEFNKLKESSIVLIGAGTSDANYYVPMVRSADDNSIVLSVHTASSDGLINLVFSFNADGSWTMETEELTFVTEEQLDGKQDELVSGTNIKTINGESILGSGDLTIESGAKIYEWFYDGDSESVTLSQEEYDNIVEADIVVVSLGGIFSFTVSKSSKEVSEALGRYVLIGQLEVESEGIKLYINISIEISTKVATITKREQEILTKTSQLDNDSNFITSEDVSAVALSGSYNDLEDKPTIPSAVTESTVSGWGFTKNTGTYSKPSGGIPKTDLANAVQTSLGKADTALQSYTEQYKGTVTGVKINGSTKNPSSGVVDLGYINKQLSASTASSMTLSPNIYYRNTSTSLSTLTITLGSVSNSNIINEYFVEFTTSSSGTTVSLPSTIKWANGEVPTFEASTTYQISIVNNLGVVTKFK